MKRLFPGYYAPTKRDYSILWNNGLIVLDTNVLLDLYRLPASARDELLGVFDALKDRIWIPYQVALEFQRRRLTVIAAERKAIEEVLSEAKAQFDQINKKVISLQIEKRGLGIDPSPLVEELRAASNRLMDAVNEAHKAQLDIAASDPIRERLDHLLESRIGPPPASQDELDALCADSDERYENRVPPGYEDSSKDKNPNEAIFYHDGLKYKRKLGDLILWRQVISHAKSKKINSVLLVTSDSKDDWWWREKGKTIGPRPELAREIERCADVAYFWMYSSSQFMDNAKRFTKATVSDQSVTQLEEVARIDAPWRLSNKNYKTIYKRGSAKLATTVKPAKVETAVRRWLSERFPYVRISEGFPDILVGTPEGIHGFEIKYARNVESLLTDELRSTIIRGALDIEAGNISQFSVVVVVDSRESGMLFDEEMRAAAKRQLETLIAPYHVEEIIVGIVEEMGEFYDIFRVRGDHDNVFS